MHAARQFVSFFCFYYTAATGIYTYCHTLSLHDALPIYADDGPEAVGVAKRLIAADLGERGQVDMHVDESGKQGPLAEVDMPDVGAPAHRARVGDVRDPPVGADEDRRIIDRLTAYDVEHVRGGDHGLAGRRALLRRRARPIGRAHV